MEEAITPAPVHRLLMDESLQVIRKNNETWSQGEWILASKKKSNQRGTGHVTESLCQKDYCFKSLSAEAAATASSTWTWAAARPTPPTCLQADWYSTACEQPPTPRPPPSLHPFPYFSVMRVFHFRVRQWQGARETAIDGFTKEQSDGIKKKKERKKHHDASLEQRPWFFYWVQAGAFKMTPAIITNKSCHCFFFHYCRWAAIELSPKGAVMLLHSHVIKDYREFFFQQVLSCSLKKKKSGE